MRRLGVLVAVPCPPIPKAVSTALWGERSWRVAGTVRWCGGAAVLDQVDVDMCCAPGGRLRVNNEVLLVGISASEPGVVY